MIIAGTGEIHLACYRRIHSIKNKQNSQGLFGGPTDAILWGFKGEEKGFFVLEPCQAGRGRRGSRQAGDLRMVAQQWRLQHLLRVGHARDWVRGGGKGLLIPALKDAQTLGSSPWLCLPLLGTLCPSQPD